MNITIEMKIIQVIQEQQQVQKFKSAEESVATKYDDAVQCSTVSIKKSGKKIKDWTTKNVILS